MGAQMLLPATPNCGSPAAAGSPRRAATVRMHFVDAARYIISGAANWRRVTNSLPVAELCRAALMGIYGTLYPQYDGSRGRSAVFAGKSQAGIPLSGHSHAFYLPTDEDGDGLLDHITVYAADGFDVAHQAALGGLSFLRLPQAGDYLKLTLANIGIAAEMVAGPLARSALWQSATPYVATRFARTRGRGRVNSPVDFLISDLLGQARGFCQRCAGAEVESVVPVLRDGAFCHPDPCGAAAGEYIRSRLRRADNGGMRHCGYFLLRFAKAVCGPVALGHSAHYGMGMFVPGEMGAKGAGEARPGHSATRGPFGPGRGVVAHAGSVKE
jgi:CRISPR-associated protein Csb2